MVISSNKEKYIGKSLGKYIKELIPTPKSLQLHLSTNITSNIVLLKEKGKKSSTQVDFKKLHQYPIDFMTPQFPFKLNSSHPSFHTNSDFLKS